MASPLPVSSASQMGHLIINPSGATPGEIETYMRGPAWWLLDMSPLWGFPDLRGEDVIIPGIDGRIGLPRLEDETVYTMPLYIIGSVTASGAATATPANALTGLRANRTYLRDNVHRPLVTGPRTVKLVLPDTSSLTTLAHCVIHLGEQKGSEVKALLELTIPAGGFD